MDAELGQGCPITYPVGRVGLFEPQPELTRLVEKQPICQLELLNGEIGWLVSSQELGRVVLSDRRFTARRVFGRQPFGELDRYLAEGAAEEGRVPHVNAIDAPDHTRRRRALMSQLAVPRAKALQPGVEAIIEERLDAMEQAGSPVDFVEMFAMPVPSLVLCELLGVPPADRDIFVRLTDRIVSPDVSAEDLVTDIEAFYDYVEGVVADKRRHPGDDMISELIRSGAQSHDELVKDAIGIFEAGHGTTTNQFGYGLLVLLQQPSRWEALKADPSTVGAVVEELLRFVTIFDANPTERIALEDIELGGATVRAGDTVVVSLLAGNRDPKRFAEPDTFDPSRDARGHFAFGFGLHMCAGQHVARLELQLGFAALARRFPALRLAAAPEDIRWRADIHEMSGPLSLPVAW